MRRPWTKAASAARRLSALTLASWSNASEVLSESPVSVRKAAESGFFLKYAADGGAADVQPARDLRFTDSLAKQFADFRGFVCRCGGPTETGAALPGVVQTGTDAFPQDVVFEGGKHGQHASHRSAGGCGQIKRFAH